MTILDSAILGVVQGLTEYLPVSSSGHLIIAEKVLGLNPEELKGFDIALHLGTLFSTAFYFRNDIRGLIALFIPALRSKKQKPDPDQITNFQSKNMAITVIAASIPALILGFLLNDVIDNAFRNPQLVAIMLMIGSVIFLVAEQIYTQKKHVAVNFNRGLIAGFVQVLALLPGISRSGITMSSAISQGVRRDEAAKFSFLIGFVVTAAAVAYGLLKIAKGDFNSPGTWQLICGIITSFAAGMYAIDVLMKTLKRISLKGFVAYRVLLAVLILSVNFYS